MKVQNAYLSLDKCLTNCDINSLKLCFASQGLGLRDFTWGLNFIWIFLRYLIAYRVLSKFMKVEFQHLFYSLYFINMSRYLVKTRKKIVDEKNHFISVSHTLFSHFCIIYTYSLLFYVVFKLKLFYYLHAWKKKHTHSHNQKLIKSNKKIN